jgi:phage shock protein E
MAERTRFEKLVADTKKNISEISPEDAAAKMKSGEAVIVDVREKEEWDGEHIPDATHLSRGTIELEIEEKFPDLNKTIITHCGGGGRSALAARASKKWDTKTSAPWRAASKRGKQQAYRRRGISDKCATAEREPEETMRSLIGQSL